MAALGDATRVVNIGAGTGSYEPADRFVVAVEPSAVMIAQRQPGAAPAVRAAAEALPFDDGQFDAAMAILTVHHWSDVPAGLAEMRRVARRRVVLTFDAEVHARTWLMDYIPEITSLPSSVGPAEAELVEGLGVRTSVEVVPVPHDCDDGMMVAYWRRPQAYLDHATHAGASALSHVDHDVLVRGLSRLEDDLRSGEWDRRYGYLRELDSFDCGLRLIVGED